MSAVLSAYGGGTDCPVHYVEDTLTRVYDKDSLVIRVVTLWVFR